MITLSDHYGIINPHELIRFSGGEIQPKVEFIWRNYELQWLNIKAHIYNNDDLMELLLLNDAVKRVYPNVPIKLVMPYFPYARQDRVCVEGEPLSVKVAANLINSCEFESVAVWDVHSPVSLALLNNVINVPASVFVNKIKSTFAWGKESFCFICPDAGARKRVEACSEKWGNIPIVYCEKQRNSNNGNIEGVIVGELPVAQHYLIIDDICDGGRTFIEIAKVINPILEKRNGFESQKSLSLYVTHGIFSKGVEVLIPHYFGFIYSANIWPEPKKQHFTLRNLIDLRRLP